MAKRIVNKAERNAERYDAKETGYRLFEDSQNGKTFDRLMPLIVSEQNIILAYRNICKNSGSKTPGTDGKTIVAIQSLPIESVIKTVRNKLNYYQPKKVRRVEIPKDNGKTRPLGIPSIWDRLIQQCILQILEPICEAKFHERNNGFRPYRSTQNAIAQCYKMAQLQNLHFVVDVDIVGFFDNIDHSKLRCYEIHDGKCTSLPYVGDGRQRSFEIYRTKRQMCGNAQCPVNIRYGMCAYQTM